MISGVAKGEAPISPKMAAKMLADFRQPAQNSKRAENENRLSERENEVLELLADGEGNKGIAAGLFISESTVKYHLRNILDKLHLENRAQVIAYANRRGFRTT